MIVYISEQGSTIHINSERLLIKKKGKTIEVLLAKYIDQIVIMGNIQLSTQTIRFLLDRKIDTVFTSLSGKYTGRLVAELGKNIQLRKIQLISLNNLQNRLKLAKGVVYAKAYNSRQLLRKFNYIRKSINISKKLNLITAQMKNIEFAKSIDELMGLEGIISSDYFSCFDEIILNEHLKFKKRTRRPPKNEFNALLSFGYTLLLNTVRTAVNIVGLDPYFGALHSESYGRPSIVLDIMEEFRSIIVDYVALSAVNKSMISKTDFILDEDDELPVKLSVDGRKKYIRLIEKRLNEKIYFEIKKKKMTFKDIIRYQSYKFAKSIIENKNYEGFLLK
jgi:CRISPR-associated protein Cas1